MLKMFLIRELILIAYFATPIILTQEEECKNINCECFKVENRIEYHCPSVDWHRKLLIQKEEDQLNWTCVNIEDIDKHLPNIKLKSKKMLISDCSLTNEAAIGIDFESLEELEILNSNISSEFIDVVRIYTSHNIRDLTLKYVIFGEDAIFKNFSGEGLRQLVLEGVDIKFGKEIFKGQRELRTLLLKSNDIRFLEEYVFEHLINLRILDLSYNKLSHMKSNTFGYLSSLKRLSLISNEIEFLEKSIFEPLFELMDLDLSHNKIRFLHRDVLEHLEALTVINIDYNDYKEGLKLDDYLFSNLTDLEIISICSSHLKSLPENVFWNSPNVKIIELRDNSISQIPDDLFRGLSNLDTIDLRKNEILELNSAVFDELWELKILHLSENKLQRLDSHLLAHQHKLLKLDLNMNEIKHIGSYFFAHKNKLQELHLSFNEIRYDAESSPFVFNLDSLEVLDLSSNFIEEIPYELLGQKKLTFLDLQKNRIKSLNIESIWKTAYKGILINLEANRITEIIFNKDSMPEDPEYSANSEVTQVYLAENPVNCDCGAITFIDFINNVMDKTSDWGIVFVLKKLRCNTPANMKGKELIRVSEYITDCDID